MSYTTVTQISEDLKAGRYSSWEITTHLLDRIAAHNPVLNSFITVTAELARKQAKGADARRAKGESHPLLGVPIAHKDNFCTQGVLTTCASRMLHNFVSPYDATVVAKAQQAGCVLLGKTNMDEFAMGSSNEHSYYGACANPWDTTRVPGGSSGGSAVSVAAGMAPLATGTDTGGSVRQPAAFCGVTGLKPTYGRISRHGMVAFASSLDQAGIFARTAEDCALLLAAISGHDACDSTSEACLVPDYASLLDRPLAGLRIGVPTFCEKYVAENAIQHVIQDALKVFTEQGATLHTLDLNTVEAALSAYYIIAPAECSSNLARFDGVRYGYRCQDPADLSDLYERSRSEGFGAEVKRRIMTGTYVLSSENYEAFYQGAQNMRQNMQTEFQSAFETVDLICTPTTPEVAFKAGAKKTIESMYASDIFTIPANLVGSPAISLPAGFVQNLPVGMQLVGRHFEESLLLNAAHQFQQTTDWHRQMPSNYPA